MASLEVSKLGFNIDLDEIEALNQKRSLAFINHWVYHTVQFLNQFASSCQQRLIQLETKLRRATDALSILESKLSSLPGLEDVRVERKVTPHAPEPSQSAAQAPSVSAAQEEEEAKVPEASVQEEEEPPGGKNLIKVSSHPKYAPFFKMVNVGVPREAVRIKMAVSGLDPSMLDDPMAEVEEEMDPATESE